MARNADLALYYYTTSSVPDSDTGNKVDGGLYAQPLVTESRLKRRQSRVRVLDLAKTAGSTSL